MMKTQIDTAGTATLQYIAENFELIQTKLELLQMNSQQILQKLDFLIEKLVHDIESIKKQDRDVEEKIELISGKITSLLVKDEEYGSSQEVYERIARQAVINWERFGDDAKQFLISAEYLYSVLQGPNKDYSPCVLQYAKALESELYNRFFKDFIDQEHAKEDISTLVFDDVKNGKTRNFAQQVLAGSEQKSLTIGNMTFIIANLESGEGSYVFAEYKSFLEHHALFSLVQNVLPIVDSIKDDLRNRAAHPEILTIEVAKEAKKVIPQVLDSFFD